MQSEEMPYRFRFVRDNIGQTKEVLYLRWNEHHLSAYFVTLMTQL